MTLASVNTYAVHAKKNYKECTVIAKPRRHVCTVHIFVGIVFEKKIRVMYLDCIYVEVLFYEQSVITQSMYRTNSAQTQLEQTGS